jgi:hypothetical protein
LSIAAPPAGSAGEKFQMFPAKVQRAVHFRRCHDAGKKRQAALPRLVQHRFVQAGRHAELRAGVHGLLHVVRREQRAGANGHLRDVFADARDGVRRRRRAEGDFHDTQAAGEQRFGQRRGAVGAIQRRDAEEPLFKEQFGIHKRSGDATKERAGGEMKSSSPSSSFPPSKTKVEDEDEKNIIFETAPALLRTDKLRNLHFK